MVLCYLALYYLVFNFLGINLQAIPWFGPPALLNLIAHRVYALFISMANIDNGKSEFIFNDPGILMMLTSCHMAVKSFFCFTMSQRATMGNDSIMTAELTFQTYTLLFLTGLCSGFVDSIAGGGGLIALPVLFSVGLPPQVALGTNKLQGSFGTLSASYNYIKKGVVRFDENLSGILFTLIGAILGAWSIQQMQAGFIEHLVPVLLLFVFFYTLFTKDLGNVSGNPRIPRHLFFFLFGLGLGFYDGFFGPGTGSFWTAALLIFLGLDMRKASGVTRIMNFTSNVVALSIFIIGQNVMYSVGLCMAVGQVIGARIGSSLAIKKGASFIRPIFLTVVFLTIVRLVWKTYFA